MPTIQELAAVYAQEEPILDKFYSQEPGKTLGLSDVSENMPPDTVRQLRAETLARLHANILETIKADDPHFVASGINIPYCGLAGLESLMLRLVYGEHVPILATDPEWLSVHRGKADLLAMVHALGRSGVRVPREGITMKVGVAQASSSYIKGANLTFQRNVPLTISGTYEISNTWFDALQTIKRVQKEGYLVVSLHDNTPEVVEKAIKTLENIGYSITEKLDNPGVDTTSQTSVQDKQREFGDAVVLICKIPETLE